MASNVARKSIAVISAHGDTTPDPLVGPTLEVSMLATQSPCDDWLPAQAESWWSVHATVLETWVDNTQGNVVLPPRLADSNVENRPSSELKFQVQWSNEDGGRSLYFDHNLQRIAVAADTIQTAVSIPKTDDRDPIVSSTYGGLTSRLVNNILPQGIVSITTIEHWAYRTIGPIGGREGRYTVRVLVPAVAPLPVVQVPPGATDVQCTGTQPLVWRWRDRPPIRPVVGTFNVPFGQSLSFPVAGTELTPTAPPNFDALYKLVFTVKF